MANSLVLASSLPNTNPSSTGSSPSPPPSRQPRTTPRNPVKPKTPLILPTTATPTTSMKKKISNTNSKLLRQQFQVLRVERAIGAGSYRDAEPPGAAEGGGSGIAELWLESDDSRSNNGSSNPFEGPVEKKIRETGEWLAYKTENEFRISEKQSLTLLYKWALPISLLLLMVAVGVIKLPFLSPLLDDFVM